MENINSRKTILVTAYAVNPYKGSENGMGWNFTRQLLRWFNVILITRENNIPHIQKYLKNYPHKDFEFLSYRGFDLPKEQRFWKKGEYLSLVYYYLWQKDIVKFIRREGFKFDLVHNLNFHNDWTPSFLWKLEKPFIWGPIGHHPTIPYRVLGKKVGLGLRFKEWVKWSIKTYFWRIDPSFQKSIAKADVLLPMNTEVFKEIELEGKSTVLMPSVGFEGFDTTSRKGKKDQSAFRILSVGRFVHLKGFDVLLDSINTFVKLLTPHERSNVKVQLIGKGPLRKYIDQRIEKYGLEKIVEVHDWLPYFEVLRLYQSADLFFFPSFEGAGMVVAEAMAASLPVLCWDNSGPGELMGDSAGISVPYGPYQASIHKFAQALHDLYSNPEMRKRLGTNAKNRFDQYLHWDRKGEALKEIIDKLLKQKDSASTSKEIAH